MWPTFKRDCWAEKTTTRSVFNCKCICIQGRRSRGNTFATCNRKKGTKEFYIKCAIYRNITYIYITYTFVYYICNTSVEQQPQKFPLLLFLTSSSSSTADCQLRSERERAAPSAQLSFQRACWIVCFDSESGPQPPALTTRLDGPAG